MKLDHLSAQLRATKDILAAGLNTAESSRSLLHRMDRLISMASLLETELALRFLSQRASDRRAYRSQLQETVLEALQEPHTNVALFPIVPRNAAPNNGGNAA